MHPQPGSLPASAAPGRATTFRGRGIPPTADLSCRALPMCEFAHVEHRTRRDKAHEEQEQEGEQAERRDQERPIPESEMEGTPQARHVIMRECVPDDQDA